MKQVLTALCLTVATVAAFAQASAPTAQQNKMASCNKDAAGKTGDDRKAFMSSCLSAKPAAAASKPMTQQDKMKQCNADANGKTGDDRKTFMSACLSK